MSDDENHETAFLVSKSRSPFVFAKGVKKSSLFETTKIFLGFVALFICATWLIIWFADSYFVDIVIKLPKIRPGKRASSLFKPRSQLKPIVDFPVVGILALPCAFEWCAGHKYYISASYVKSLQSAGAHVTPIFLNDHEETLFANLDQCDAIFIPHGASIESNSAVEVNYLQPQHIYAKTLKHIMNYFVQKNNEGVYTPLMAVGDGLPALVVSATHDHNLIGKFINVDKEENNEAESKRRKPTERELLYNEDEESEEQYVDFADESDLYKVESNDDGEIVDGDAINVSLKSRVQYDDEDELHDIKYADDIDDNVEGDEFAQSRGKDKGDKKKKKQVVLPSPSKVAFTNRGRLRSDLMNLRRPAVKDTMILVSRGRNVWFGAHDDIVGVAPEIVALARLNVTMVHKGRSFFNTVASSTDAKGKSFVSILEGNKYPLYATAFQTQAPAYDRQLNKVQLEADATREQRRAAQQGQIPHTFNAIQANSYFNTFFVDEARFNKHRVVKKSFVKTEDKDAKRSDAVRDAHDKDAEKAKKQDSIEVSSAADSKPSHFLDSGDYFMTPTPKGPFSECYFFGSKA